MYGLLQKYKSYETPYFDYTPFTLTPPPITELHEEAGGAR
jgi:hypothetical protein